MVAHGSLLLLAATFLALYWIAVPGLVLILALLAALFASINFGALFHLASRSVTSQSLATLVGFINFLANLSAIGVTILFGWIRDSTGSFTAAFPVLSIFALAALAIGRRPLKRRVAEDQETAESKSTGQKA